MKLSEAQKKAVELALGGDGLLHRWPGGFWTTKGMAIQRYTPSAGGRMHAVPEAWVGTNTVMAAERKGAMERANCFEEYWRDPRRVTEAGRAALKEGGGG